MIFESSNWKAPLLESVTRFRRFQKRKRLTDRGLTQIEKDVFIGFYAIRKLCDARGKITDSVRKSQWQLRSYKNTHRVTSLNNHKIDENYDLLLYNTETRDLEFLCGRIIHSFVFVIASNDDGGFDGVFFASDHDRNRNLYYLSADKIIEIFERVGNDWVLSYHWQLDPITGDEIIETK
jgi:hypothetical protein